MAGKKYRQRAVCEAEGVAFASKVDLMAEVIQRFEPVARTRTRMLPSQPKQHQLYVHVILTRIKKLNRHHLVIACGHWEDDEEKRTLYWPSSPLQADLETLLGYIATCWDVGVRFADTKCWSSPSTS